MTQAQTISNLCNQRAVELESRLLTNNYRKEFVHQGQTYLLQEGKPLDENVFAYIQQIGDLRACQAFLMENIKAKNNMLIFEKVKAFDYPDFDIPRPSMPMHEFEDRATEEWGWIQLSAAELVDYYEAEARAAAIGKFIHKGGQLDILRNELKKGIPSVEFIEMAAGVKTPVNVIKHHTSEELLSLHEKLAMEHRTYEQKVNYFKAKVQNLVTQENARRYAEKACKVADVQQEYSRVMEEYNAKLQAYEAAKNVAEKIFQKEKQEEIKRISNLRIAIPEKFQPVIDMFNGVQEK